MVTSLKLFQQYLLAQQLLQEAANGEEKREGRGREICLSLERGWSSWSVSQIFLSRWAVPSQALTVFQFWASTGLGRTLEGSQTGTIKPGSRK